MRLPKIQARHWNKPSFEKMASQLRRGVPSETDESLKNLVLAISSMEDIAPLSSCGGQKKPCGKKGKVARDDFFVLFFVKPTQKGFRSLGTIVEAASNIDPENIWVKVDNLTDNPDFIDFDLRGTNGVSPDELAEEITYLYGIFKHPKKTWPVLSENISGSYSQERGQPGKMTAVESYKRRFSFEFRPTFQLFISIHV